jgi:hypothetical protein
MQGKQGEQKKNGKEKQACQGEGVPGNGPDCGGEKSHALFPPVAQFRMQDQGGLFTHGRGHAKGQGMVVPAVAKRETGPEGTGAFSGEKDGPLHELFLFFLCKIPVPAVVKPGQDKAGKVVQAPGKREVGKHPVNPVQ